MQMIEKLEEISIDYKSQNHEALYRTAHAIKSMSANIGAEKVRSVSAHIELLARKAELEGIDNLISRLTEAYQEFLSVFELELLE